MLCARCLAWSSRTRRGLQCGMDGSVLTSKTFVLIFATFLLTSSLPGCEAKRKVKTLEDLNLDLERLAKEADTFQLEDLPIPPELEFIKTDIEKLCREVGGDDAVKQAEKAQKDFVNCIRDNFNAQTIIREAQEAIPVGNLDQVFKKYCGKVPLIEVCLNDSITAIKGCLKPSEYSGVDLFYEAASTGMRFACHDDGDRIAVFIAEDGFSCLTETVEPIQACINETGKVVLPDVVGNRSHFLEFGEEHCSNIRVLEKCMVETTLQCSDPTPSNVIESFFKAMIKVTPCKPLQEAISGSVCLVPSLFTTSLIFSLLLTVGTNAIRR